MHRIFALVLCLTAGSITSAQAPPELSFRGGYEDNVLTGRVKGVFPAGTVEWIERDASRSKARLDMAFPVFEADLNKSTPMRLGMSFEIDELTDMRRLDGKPPDGRGYLLGIADYPSYLLKLRYPLAYMDNSIRWYPSAEIEGKLKLSSNFTLLAKASYSPDPDWGFKADAGLGILWRGLHFRIMSREATVTFGNGYRF